MLILRRRRKRRAPGVGTLKSSISRRALSQFDRVLLAALGGTHSYVQRFHTQRECHGEVDVAFWYVDIKGFGDQNRSNNDQEGKREYLERGMTLDKRTDGTCSNHHDHDRDHNRCDHDGYMVDHADSCDYGIQREHDVDDRNLDDGSNEVPGGAFGLAILVFALHAVIDLGAAFPEKEKAAEEQDQIAARYPLAEEMEQIRRKPHRRSAIRVTIASARPKNRVRACIWAGIRLTKIAIMMMLSMPSTISNAVSVRNATQISGLVSHSISCVSLVCSTCAAAESNEPYVKKSLRPAALHEVSQQEYLVEGLADERFGLPTIPFTSRAHQGSCSTAITASSDTAARSV